MVERLEEYRWSSHHGYLSKNDKWALLYKDFILTMLSKDPAQYYSAYKKFMHDDEKAEISDLFKKKKLPAILGSQNFISWVKETYYSEKQDKQIPDSSVLAPDIFQIKRLISGYYEINPSELSNTHRGVTNEPGDVAIFLTRKL